jgi:hypothetical protein
LNKRVNPALMKSVFICTVLYYNTPVFYKVSQLTDTEYFAQSIDDKLISFKMKKDYGTWYGEGETSHSLAAQIGKQIDKSIAALNARDNSDT